MMKCDGRQSETSLLLQRGCGRLLRDLGAALLYEFTLPSARRADIMALFASGEIWIIEIKSSLEDYRSDAKWPDYRDYCDRFYFAVPPTLDRNMIDAEAGLMVADNWGADIIRQAPPHPLHQARRKVLTLDFARIAAFRLQSMARASDDQVGTT